MSVDSWVPLLTIVASLLLVVTSALNFSVFLRQLGASREQLETARRHGFLGPGPVTDHISHAVGLAEAVPQPPRQALDLGSGAGVPGLILALWVVCGLVSASRFRYDVSAVSTSVVLIAIAVVLLALCCWPFLRVALIDPSQPLTITDVVLIIICTIVGAAWSVGSLITFRVAQGIGGGGLASGRNDGCGRSGRNSSTNF